MKKKRVKILSILLITLIIFLIGINVYAHSGRTDSRGGHKDNNNKSGLGNYHYHCGGNPAHLHTNGVCPYSSNSSSSSTTTTKVPVTIDVTGIQINENINTITVGESQKLTATITPKNATNKNIIWKTSDESIATISSLGEVVAKKPGTINITASTSNGKTSMIKINIEEKKEIENSVIMSNMNTDKQEDSNPLGNILTLGILGSGGYYGYKKYKKSK